MRFWLYPFIEVKAAQWLGHNFEDLRVIAGKRLFPVYSKNTEVLRVICVEGVKEIHIGDYLVRREEELLVFDPITFRKNFKPIKKGNHLA